MPILIAAATARELDSALSPLGPLPPLTAGRAAPWQAGGRDCLLLVTGVGPVNAALRLGQALARAAVAGVVNLGVAGSFDTKRLPVTATAAVELEIWPEYGLRGDEGVDPHALGFALFPENGSGGPIWDRVPLDPAGAAEAMGLSLDPAWPLAASLTVAGVTATAEGAARQAVAYGADLENMEGFSLAYACHLERIPFLEVRTVSNRVGPRSLGGWDLAGALGALGLAARRLLS